MSHRELRSYALKKAASLMNHCSTFFWLAGINLSISNYALTHRSREDDIFVATFPKSGTTWMLNILWEILHPDVDFNNISNVVPTLEEHLIPLNIDIHRPRTSNIIKSHLPIKKIVKGDGKYIYVTRNAPDVSVSCYHHQIRYRPQLSDGNIENFIRKFFHKERYFYCGDWFSHVAQWTGDRSLKHLLIVRYEDLQTQFDVEIERIAKFLGVEVGEEQFENIRRKCSFQYMKENVSRFDNVRNGVTGSGREYMTKKLKRSYIRSAKPYMHLPIIAGYVQMQKEA